MKQDSIIPEEIPHEPIDKQPATKSYFTGLKDEPKLHIEDKIPILKKPTSDSQGLQKQKSSVSQKKVSIYEERADLKDEKDSIISEEDSAFEETPAAKKMSKKALPDSFT